MTGNCSARWRVLANSLRMVSAKKGHPPLLAANSKSVENFEPSSEYWGPPIALLIHVFTPFFGRIHVVTHVEVPFSRAHISCCSLLDLIVRWARYAMTTGHCLKADFLSWQKPLASWLRVLAGNFSLLPAPRRVLAAWFKIFN